MGSHVKTETEVRIVARMSSGVPGMRARIQKCRFR